MALWNTGCAATSEGVTVMIVDEVRSPPALSDVGAACVQTDNATTDGPPGRQDARPGY